nr:FliG C-terminal domain-containing protein [Jannaschia sp. S6380]
MSPASGTPAKPALTRRQKAAVVVHLLISGGVDPGLRDLPPAQQRDIVREMARLRFVDRATLALVIAEFATELDSIGLHFPRDMARVLTTLESRLSLDVVDALNAELGPDAQPGDSPWAAVETLDTDAMLQLVEGETDEVAAILMSKLPAERAAELMTRLSVERAPAVATAFARTEEVKPTAVARIGMALGRQSAGRTSPAFETDGVRRIGDILNVARTSVRRTILESLDATDPDFANRVRKAVFSYENIPDRIDPRDLPKVLKEVDGNHLRTALAGTPEELASVKTFLLGNISSRLADQIREEIAELSTAPPAAEVEEAMGTIVATIRRLAETGEITLLIPEAERE